MKTKHVVAGLSRITAGNERGQAMTEYIVGFAAIVGLIAFSLTFREAITSYLRPIYFTVSLPIP